MYATDWMSSVIAKAAKFVVLAGEGGREGGVTAE